MKGNGRLGVLLAWGIILATASAGEAAAAVATTAPTAATGPAAIDLARRYADVQNGFSLRPPAASDRQKQPSPTQLVSWMQRDATTGAIRWTLTVQKVVESAPIADLKSYSATFADKLKTQENFKQDKLELGKVQGADSFDLSGVTGGKVHLWQRQVWISRPGGRFLALVIAGPPDARIEMNHVFDAVLATLQLIDPAAAQAAEQAALKRGAELLAGLNDAKIQAVLNAEPTWMLIKVKGKDDGFWVWTEKQTSQDGVKGLLVAAHFIFKSQAASVSQNMFTTADRSQERWTQKLVAGTDKASTQLSEDGTKLGPAIRCSITQGGKTTSVTAEAPSGNYLPLAMGMILSRLVDLSVPQSYAFISYVAQGNTFATRTLTVEGPDSIVINGQQTPCTRLSDQASADAEPMTVYVDKAGRILRMISADGLTMEANTAPAVAKLFPEAKNILKD